MAFLRWVFRPDARLVIAAIATAAALLVPVAGLLALEHLAEPRPGSTSTTDLVVTSANGPFAATRLPADTLAAVRHERDGERLLVAFVVGDPRIGQGEAWPMPNAAHGVPPGLVELPRAAQPIDLVPSEAVLVAPGKLSTANGLVDSARVPAKDGPALAAQGFTLSPAYGGEAYVAGSLQQVRASSWALLVATLPVVAAIAVVFGDLEAKEGSRLAATLSALGRPGLGRLILAARILVLLLVGTALAALGGVILANVSAVFRPTHLPWTGLAAALLAPLALGAVCGIWRIERAVGPAVRQLRGTRSSMPVSPMSRRISPLAQPMVLGWAILPVAALAGMLFVVDLGFPLAVGSVPAAVTGPPGETVVSSSPQAILGGSTAAALANVAADDPNVDAAVAEALAPTVLAGEPVLVRGADWAAFASFHGAALTSGHTPDAGQVLLGDRLAARTGLGLGSTVTLAASTRPLARTFTVAGTFSAGGLLADEAFVTMADGQDLAGLGAGQASVVRARPDTPEAIAALQRTQADLVVTLLSTTPRVAGAGQLVTAHVEVTNLGPRAGERRLEARVNDEPVGVVNAALPGYSRATYDIPFVAPSGAIQLRVNPTLDVTSAVSTVRLLTTARIYDTQAIEVYAVKSDGAPVSGLTVGLFSSISDAANRTTPLAQARADADGLASFPARPAGHYVAATMATPAAAVAFDVVDHELAGSTLLVIERLSIEPANPHHGEPVQAHVRLRNLGGAAADGRLELGLDGGILNQAVYRLSAGDAITLDGSFTAAGGRHNLTALDARLPFRVDGAIAAAPVRVEGGGVHASRELQKAAADQALGDARGSLLALGATALSSSIALLYLATSRTVVARAPILPTLWALGMTPEELKRRLRLEAAAAGAVAALVALLVGAALFWLAGAAGWPMAFGHTLPQPVDPVFVLQAMLGFACVSALAVSAAARSVLRPAWLRRPTDR